MAEFDDHEAGNKLARAFDYIEEEETHFVNFDDENEEFGVFRALMVEDSDEDGYLIARAFEYIEEEDEEEEAQFVNLDEETDFFGDLRALMVEDSDDDDDEVISENKDRREGTLWRRVSAVGAQSFEVKSSAGSNLTDTETDDGPNSLQADTQFQEKEKEVNIQKEIPLDEKLCDQHFENELPKFPPGNDMSDASFNTQLAAEVMKSLLYAPPPITDVKSFNQTELNLESLTENVKKSRDKPLKAVTKRRENLEDDVVKQPRKKPKNSLNRDIKKRNKIRERKSRKGAITKDDKVIRLPNPMTGFGTPTVGNVITHRTLPEAAIAPPYFYYENVARATKGVWDKISRFLYDVQPEFVDSKYFCAAARKRGYIHNLPIKNRFPLEPLPPQTITDALPLTKRWWPKWDKRNKLNCLQTVLGSAKVTERIRKALEKEDDGPSQHVQKYVIEECRKWNLVWIGKNKVATLEPDEVEMLLGFPRNHTRGGGISRTNRYKSLGNSFQVDTVAYHLSVLKDIFPKGINLLSLFSGIGGAEVALHRLGIPLNNVVSVEISEANRDIVRSWWEQTNQKGKLVHLTDVQEVNDDCLKQLMGSFGGFDLVVGGSPCNNLAGSNRVSRDGLEGEQSSLFYDYFRILDSVKRIMNNKQ